MATLHLTTHFSGTKKEKKIHRELEGRGEEEERGEGDRGATHLHVCFV
jgi:hypothetical protein